MKSKGTNDMIHEILFDGEHTKPLIMVNNWDTKVRFEEIYAVEREDGIYCILRPLASVKGLRPDSALLFHVDRNGTFRFVKDKELTDEIFLEYYNAYHDEVRWEGDGD